jgi:hypothetical protein
MIIYLSSLLRMRNVSDESFRKNCNTRFMVNNFSFRKSCRLLDHVKRIFESWAGHTWQYGACAFHDGYLNLQTHRIYITLIAFLLQQWLHESASILSDMFIARLFQISQTLRHKRSILYFWVVKYQIFPLLRKKASEKCPFVSWRNWQKCNDESTFFSQIWPS